MSDSTELAIDGRLATPDDPDWDQARASVCTRLAEVKRRYDPDGRIVGNHVVALDPAV